MTKRNIYLFLALSALSHLGAKNIKLEARKQQALKQRRGCCGEGGGKEEGIRVESERREATQLLSRLSR